jgi:hypothetical protein
MKKTLILIVMIWLSMSHLFLNAAYSEREQQAALCCGWMLLKIMCCMDCVRDICCCCRGSKIVMTEDEVSFNNRGKKCLPYDVKLELIEPLCPLPQSKSKDSDLSPFPRSRSKNSDMHLDEIFNVLSRSRVEKYVTNPVLDFDSSNEDLHFPSTNPVNEAEQLLNFIAKNKETND